MKPKTRIHCELDLFNRELTDMIDEKHELIRPGQAIDWQFVEERIGTRYAHKGRPGANIRLMLGLHILKHMRDLCDEAVLEAWLENPYFQAFTGEQFFQHQRPIDRPTMTKFRKRMGLEELEAVLAQSLNVALSSGAMHKRHLTRIAVDTTVQPKAISYPSDGKLLYKCIIALNRFAKLTGSSCANLMYVLASATWSRLCGPSMAAGLKQESGLSEHLLPGWGV